MNLPKQEVYWYSKKKPQIKKLENDTATGVCIVGGGMAGLSAAQKLRQAGKRVILLECNFCGGGASGKSSGFLTPDSELQLSDLLEKYGPEGATKLREFVNVGLDRIRENIQKYNIDCDYQIQDSLFVANSDKSFKKVKDEHEARVKLGYESHLHSKEKMPEILGGREYFGGVRYPGSFGLNTYLYCQAMKEILEKEGVTIYEYSQVININNGEVEANGFKVKAKDIIIATDHFLPKSKLEKPNVYHAQTFLAVSELLSEAKIKQIFPQDQMMVWDTDLIYQYFRLIEGNKLLFGASSLIYTYQPKEATNSNLVLKKIQKYLQRKFNVSDIKFEYTWSGLIGVAKDLVPIAGKDPVMKDVYFVSAATGLPWAAALGQYIAEKVINGRSDYDSYFNPWRHYPISNKLQFILSKPLAFALSHGIIKLFE